MTAPRRRWSFSLRTLFVVVTALACGTWQVAIYLERSAAREWMRGHRGSAYAATGAVHDPTIAIWRTWCGDQAIRKIELPAETATEDDLRIRRVFPEAIVDVGP